MTRDLDSISFFITGMARSGTTLVDKVLANHTDVSALSQPFPLLFVHLKKRLYEQIQYAGEALFLSDWFGETEYTLDELSDHLRTAPLTRDEIERVFESMRGYSGRYHEVEDYSERLNAYRDATVLEGIAQLLRLLSYQDQARAFGSKETFCEEFIPAMLESDFRVVVIVRDPRDVMSSLIHGSGQAHAGQHRPLLFSIRSWRKSVAFALRYDGHPRFLFLRYEDLVRDPLPSLNRMTDLLGVERFAPDAFDDGIADQAGVPWQSNSSYDPSASISKGSVGAYEGRFDEELVAYIETACYPEMLAVGYEPSVISAPDPDRFATFVEPFPIVREDFEPLFQHPRRSGCR